MKLTFRAAAIAALALVATSFGLTGVAEAGTVSIYDHAGKYNEFGVYGPDFSGATPPQQANLPVVPGFTTPLFTTFCLEHGEGINSHHQTNGDVSLAQRTVYDWVLNTAAVAGGPGAVNGSDPLDFRTAYLYTQFYNGVLNNFDYTVGLGREADGKSLQLAIWYLEDEVTVGELDVKAAAWVTEATLAGWTNLGNVRVMNVYTASGANAQDLLVMVPLPPAAWLGLGLMSAMGAVGIIRRRRRQALA
jgi:hypothetical protein